MAPFRLSAIFGVFFAIFLAIVNAAPSEHEEELAFLRSLNVEALTDTASQEVEAHQPLASTPNLIAKYGYPAETHTVTTADGYLLALHRIPNPGKPVVFIQHGLLSSSADWVVLGPKKALALMIFDAGYDIWLGNSRGSTYSRAHVSLDTSDGKFWDFSWHEIGVMDLPASIDYILERTGEKDLVYVGHSQGTTTFFVMVSTRPEYNEKVRAMFALAPIAFLNEIRSFPLRVISVATSQIEFVAKMLGMHEFLPSTTFVRRLGTYLCSAQSITQALCTNVMFLICGFDSHQMNKTLLPEILQNAPAGASTKQLIHYGQLITQQPIFRQFDYGWIRNLIYYGSWNPPSYDLSKVTTRVHLHYGDNDLIAVPQGVSMLHEALPNSVDYYRVPYDYFNHVDFLYAKDAHELLYSRVLTNIKESFLPTKKLLLEKVAIKKSYFMK